jgi:hypothetical protein
MKILHLDHEQRLNIIAMLDGIEPPDKYSGNGRRGGWVICALQDKLKLSDEEKTAIGFREVQNQDGRKLFAWSNQEGSLRDYELPDDDIEIVCHALDKFKVILGRDRRWWLPLVAQLPEPVESNGAKAPAIAA